MYLTDLKNLVEYPIELKSGAEWQLAIPYSELARELDKRDVRRVSAIVNDTLGKTYKSSWLRPPSFNISN